MKIDTYHANGVIAESVDTRNIDDVKSAKWDEANAFRDTVLDRGFWYMGHNWGSDDRSRANVTGAVAGAIAGIPLPSGFTWRDNNNNNVPFTITDMITLGGYVLAYVNLVYNASWEIKTAIDAQTTLSDLDAFIVSMQTWPDGNMDGTKPS